jgi:DNA-binding NarL/FixJ family response regulator
MPIMDGFATITALKGMNPMLRTIVASGHSTSEVRARASDAGADAFIDKPYTVEVLVRTIDDVLHQRPVRQADGDGSA